MALLALTKLIVHLQNENPGLNIKERRELLDGSLDEVKRGRRNALAELDRFGAKNSFRKWWAFEGFSSADCFLETDDMVLLIEGKRNDNLAPATRWYPKCNQLARNLEVAECHANGKQFGVLLINEDVFEVSQREIEKGWPYLDLKHRDDLWTHYLGSLTWPVVCSAAGLPQSVLEPDVDKAMMHLRDGRLI